MKTGRKPISEKQQARAYELLALYMPWLEREVYDIVLRESGELVFYSAGELMAAEPPPSLQAALEQNYRRGYHQGYGAAIDDRANGVGFTDCAIFHDSELLHWRKSSHKGRMDIPPRAKKKARP